MIKNLEEKYSKIKYKIPKPCQKIISLVPKSLFFLRLRTSKLRCNPDFIIIGAQKSGTTSLYDYICQSNNVVRAFRKEPNYFNKFYEKGNDWYRAFFPLKPYLYILEKIKGKVVTGESSTNTMANPKSCDRLYKFNSKIKIIVILREPISRVYSAYQHMIRSGKENLSFEEAIKKDEPGTFRDYIYRSEYYNLLKPYFDRFPKENILVLSFNDLKENPEEVTKQTLDFLQVHTETKNIYFQVKNPGEYSVNISNKTKDKLKKHFEPHNKNLHKLFGKKLW